MSRKSAIETPIAVTLMMPLRYQMLMRSIARHSFAWLSSAFRG